MPEAAAVEDPGLAAEASGPQPLPMAPAGTPIPGRQQCGFTAPLPFMPVKHLAPALPSLQTTPPACAVECSN